MGLTVRGTGGTGTSSQVLISTTKLGMVRAAMPLTVVSGSAPGDVFASFTGATLQDGEDYYGIPGSALPLGLTIDGSGNIVLPADDHIYDIYASAQGTGNAADAGKLIGFFVGGDNADVALYVPLNATGAASVKVNLTDYVFTGDGAFPLGVTFDTSALSEDFVFSALKVFVSQR